MNEDVNQADKSRYTEQVSGGVLTTASLREKGEDQQTLENEQKQMGGR